MRLIGSCRGCFLPQFRKYRTLQPSDLLNALRYVERHTQEIDREIQENEADD